MPEPDERMELLLEIYRETNYDTHTLSQFIIKNESRLVDDQNVCYCILNSMENERVTFFIDAPGDTGKTFLINLLLIKVHKNIVHAVVSSGMAATLLMEGELHNSFFVCP